MARPTPTLGTSAIGARQWPDEWLLQSFEGMQAADAELLRHEAGSAWEALARCGVPDDAILQRACAVSATKPAQLQSVDAGAAHLLDAAVASRYGVAPVELRGGALVVACSNPLSSTLEQELAFATARRVILTTQTPAAIRAARTRIYGESSHESPPVQTGAPCLEWVAEMSKARGSNGAARGEAVELLDELLIKAISQRASDVHLEPGDDGMLVRLRVDGALFDYGRVRKEAATLLVSRLKVMAGLDITERRRPQDGRASARFEGRTVDFRISTLPLGAMVEKVVVRVLDSRASSTGLAELGFSEKQVGQLGSLLSGKEGMILVAGPTGAGKTTSIYSMMRLVQEMGNNIVTVEDPIEYRLEGITQIQINEQEGLTFSNALRSILRQDSDLVMVGEIRDAETAQIASKASVTGHLVLASLHSNDAPAAVQRLLDVGADAAGLARALRAVVAQRLVRRLCSSCSVPTNVAELPADQQALLEQRRTDELRKPVGCAECRGTGYRGRVVVSELMIVTPELQRAIAGSAQPDELAELSRGTEMTPLWEAGLARVLAGETSLHELLDTVAAPVVHNASAQQDIDALLASLRAGDAGRNSGGSALGNGVDAMGGAAPDASDEESRAAGAAEQGASMGIAVRAGVRERATEGHAGVRAGIAAARSAKATGGQAAVRTTGGSGERKALGIAASAGRAGAEELAEVEGVGGRDEWKNVRSSAGRGAPPRLNDTAPSPVLSHHSDAPDHLLTRTSPQADGAAAALRVLIVDDDRASRAATRAALETAGFTVMEAADGESGLAYARRLHPDAVLTEIALPRLDGIGLLQSLANDPTGAEILVFVHTTQTDDALLSWLSDLGADGILPKTLSPQALCFALRRARVEAA